MSPVVPKAGVVPTAGEAPNSEPVCPKVLVPNPDAVVVVPKPLT